MNLVDGEPCQTAIESLAVLINKVFHFLTMCNFFFKYNDFFRLNIFVFLHIIIFPNHLMQRVFEMKY